MAINGRDSNGDADRNLEELEDDYLPPNFKEYLRQEELNLSRHKLERLGVSYFGWVFWSQKDHEIEPSLSRDNCPGFNPKVGTILNVRDNIRDALTQFILSPELNSCLLQFWAPITTSEGRTVLVTQYQPFALGTTAGMSSRWRQHLCEYRMKMCGQYNFFYADAQSREEQLGLPGRVFLHQIPESTPHVKYYSTKEYPQLDLALSCNIIGSRAVPLLEYSSQTCVGVLEIVHPGFSASWRDRSQVRLMCDIFQEFGLQLADGYKICEMHYREKIKREKALTPAFRELNRVLRSVCQIHELPLAMTWVPCSSCNGLLRGQLLSKDGFSTGVEFFTGAEFHPHFDNTLNDFLNIGKRNHLRKGLVAGRPLSSPDMLYCSDIAQLSVDEYPLVPYARQCKLSSWFTICLQSIYTGNDIYVLEFFLSTRSKDNENLTTLRFILGTMAGKFETFRLASGKDMGELMSFEVINFQNDQKVHSIQLIQATRHFSSISSDPSSVRSSPSVASTMRSVQLIQATRIFPSLSSDLSSMQSSAGVANTRPGFEDENMVTIKAKYAYYTIKFKLSLPCRLVELQQEVAKRLKPEAGTYNIWYEDELAGLIFIACDEGLQAWVDASI